MNRQWPQARLYAAGLVTSPLCQFCLAAAQRAAEETGTPLDYDTIPHGTLEHRLWCCPVIRAPLEHAASRGLLREASDLMHSGPLDAAMWLRGLVPVSYGTLPELPARETFNWVKRPVDDVFTGTAYTDGSLLDGPPQFCGLCGRLGWAFVVLDNAGHVVASAHGVPPPWVTTIHGAELWAVQMATSCALPGTAFRTDCLSVVQVYRRGRQVAAAAGCYYARIWNVIFSHLDDCTDVDLEWMPAHSKPDDVGKLLLSDGAPLTERDRMANAEADRLAKLAAASVRVPADVRGSIAAARGRAWQLACWIGRATATAAGHLLPTWLGRDSRPGPRPPRTARGTARESRAAPQTRQRPADDGGHLLERFQGGWRCTICRCTSSSWSVLAPARCSGPALQRWTERAAAAVAAGVQGEGLRRWQHRLAVTGDVHWCEQCGAYAEQRGSGLGRACRGRPANPSAAARLRALLAGRHPVTGEALLDDVLVPVVSDEEVARARARGAARWSALQARVRARKAAVVGAD